MCKSLARRAGFALASAAVFTVLAAKGIAADRASLALAAASITKGELKVHVDTLADDTFEGREAGSRGGRAAGNYLLKAFEQAGLKPAGDSGTYFQAFNGTSRNILGILEGSDPQLKSQVVLIGAHYDHVGYGRVTNSFGPWGYIHNGADDNGSGVAGLLEILGAVKQLPQPPRRSILFVFWDQEEAGLIGSRHWISHPTVALENLVFAINIDMIGRMKNGRMEVYGTRTAAGLRRLISESNVDRAAEISFTWKMKADSDHWPFFERRIPVVMFHTGLHEDYHRPSDDTHRINHDGLKTATQMAFYTLLAMADADRTPPFREASRREAPSNMVKLEQPIEPNPSRYGLPYRFEPGDPPSVVLTGVTAGSPSEQAGLRAGDRLTAFQGRPIADEMRFRLELLVASGEVTFTVERPGLAEPMEVKLTPLGTPIRFGISWRPDEGEPGSVLITQVIYGSAAHSAGVQLKDRIYAVGGRPFANQEEFLTLISQMPGPIELLVERAGKLATLKLDVLDPPPAAE
jgi:hypothetical protein